jgi:signal transduction histidine kinase
VRERLLAAFVALTLLTVMLYAVPRALLRADVVGDQAQREVDLVAEVAAELLTTRLQAGLATSPLPLAFADDDQVVYRTGSEVELLAGPASGRAGDAVTASRDVSGGGTLEVRRSRDVVRRQVVQEVTPILLTGLASLVVAVLAALILSSRLARPFQLLAARASALGQGDDADLDDAELPVREAEAIASALRTSGARVTTMLRREREFARNASHQLRTPLTGLRLRVEDLTLWPETPDVVKEELAHVLGEVDRLSSTVTALLAFSRDEQLGTWEAVEPAELLARLADRWGPLAAAAGRALRASAGAPATAGGSVTLPRIAVDQVLDVLVDNALRHGEGAVTVSVIRAQRAVRFVVEDGGTGLDGVLDADVFRRRTGGSSVVGSEGIGLALCADLAQFVGGRLVLTGRTPTTFELVLPLQPVG